MELSTKQGCIWTLLMYRVLQIQPGRLWSGADLKATSHLVAGVENFEIHKDSEASAWVSYWLSHLQPYWNLARKLVIRTPEDLLSWQYPGVFSFKGVSVAVSYCWQSPEFSQGMLDTDWPFHPPSHLEHCEGWRGLRAQRLAQNWLCTSFPRGKLLALLHVGSEGLRMWLAICMVLYT